MIGRMDSPSSLNAYSTRGGTSGYTVRVMMPSASVERKEGSEVERDNYNLVYEAGLKPGTSLDDLYYEFNMQHPKDFRGHSMSVSDIVVLHKGDEPVAVDFDDLMEKADERGQEEICAVKSDQEIVADFRAKTEEMFDPKPLDGMTPATIEEAVREKVIQIAEDYGLDVTVEDFFVNRLTIKES